MTLRWNYDKPHRCPECHAVWTWQAPLEGIDPKWWKTYTCKSCGAVFSGRWAWAERLRDTVRGRLNYWRRKWRMRRGK